MSSPPPNGPSRLDATRTPLPWMYGGGGFSSGTPPARHRRLETMDLPPPYPAHVPQRTPEIRQRPQRPYSPLPPPPLPPRRTCEFPTTGGASAASRRWQNQSYNSPIPPVFARLTPKRRRSPEPVVDPLYHHPSALPYSPGNETFSSTTTATASWMSDPESWSPAPRHPDFFLPATPSPSLPYLPALTGGREEQARPAALQPSPSYPVENDEFLRILLSLSSDGSEDGSVVARDGSVVAVESSGQAARRGAVMAVAGDEQEGDEDDDDESQTSGTWSLSSASDSDFRSVLATASSLGSSTTVSNVGDTTIDDDSYEDYPPLLLSLQTADDYPPPANGTNPSPPNQEQQSQSHEPELPSDTGRTTSSSSSSNDDSNQQCYLGSLLGPLTRLLFPSSLFRGPLLVNPPDNAGTDLMVTSPLSDSDLDPVEKCMLCPILQEVMRDPVVDPDGHSYERAAILEWLSRKSTSPVTRKRLDAHELRPNRALQQVIATYMRQKKNQKNHCLQEG